MNQLAAESDIIPQLFGSPSYTQSGKTSLSFKSIGTEVRGVSILHIFGPPYLSYAGDLADNLGTEFIYASNITDLWRFLRKKLKDIGESQFDPLSFMIIKRAITVARSSIHIQLYEFARRREPQNPSLQKLKLLGDVMQNSQFPNITQTQFAESEIMSSVKLNEKVKMPVQDIYKCFIELKEVKNYLKDLNEFMEELLMFVYRKIRTNQELQQTKHCYVICLIVTYLKIFINNRSFKSLILSDLPLTNLYLNLLGDKKGGIRLLKFFEDANQAVIKSEYEQTKSCLKALSEKRQ